MIGNIQKGRIVWILCLLALGLLVMAGCGAEATPTPSATDTPAAAAPTDTAAPVVTSTTEMTPTEVMTGTTPSAGTSGGATSNATPVSDWKPGGHPNSVPTPSKLVAANTLTVGSDASYPPQE